MILLAEIKNICLDVTPLSNSDVVSRTYDKVRYDKEQRELFLLAWRQLFIDTTVCDKVIYKTLIFIISYCLQLFLILTIENIIYSGEYSAAVRLLSNIA